MCFGGRKEIFRSLVGSYNYNLNTLESDKDYKIFIAPTFDDLYFNTQFNKSYIGKDEDLDIHDIRNLPELWWKANVNFLEVLFSIESVPGENINIDTKNILEAIFYFKDKIAKMNLPYLYNACIGMHNEKIKYLTKGTDNTKHFVEKFGYDLKQAQHAWRILDFLRRFADTNFNDFKKAIWYEYDDNKREFLLDIKSGKYTLDEYKEIVQDTLNDVETYWKSIYQSQKSDEETKDILINFVKKIVKANM